MLLFSESLFFNLTAKKQNQDKVYKDRDTSLVTFVVDVGIRLASL